jgi:pilus assembly protein CpaC
MIMNSRWMGLRAFLLALLFAAAPLHAQDVVTLEVNEGVMIALPGKAVSVATASDGIADVQVVSDSAVFVLARSPGETTVLAMGDGNRVLLNRKVAVTHNLSTFNRTLKQLMPETRVLATSVDGGIVLSGTVKSATEAENVRRLATRFVADENQIINQMDVSGPTQVHLRVRVAEISRDVTKQFGIDWESFAGGGSWTFGVFRGRDFLESIDDPVLGPTQQITRFNDRENLFLQFNNGRQDINAMVDALNQNGLIKILAEPSLTALSGESASFLAGGEFPIPMVGRVESGGSRISIEYKEFGVSLKFRPVLLGEGRINLAVRPEVSQISDVGAVTVEGFRIPAISTRRAETTVELGSGQSFVIAGLLQNDVSQSLRKYPLLGDVPVLGSLFRSTNFQSNETELVIIVTPYLVEPTSQKLAAPTDGFIAPTDAERLFEGRQIGRAPVAPKVPPQAPVTPDLGQPSLNGRVGYTLN